MILDYINFLNEYNIDNMSVRYLYIVDWYKKYQRDSSIPWLPYLDEVLGRKNDLFDDKKYTLYRGFCIYINPDINFKVNQIVDDSKTSWTTDINTAIRFAKGNRHHLDNNSMFGSQLGFVLQYEPKPNEILLDSNYIQDHPYFKNIQIFNEDEVILSPVVRKCKIVKLIHNNKFIQNI